nr:hypothetical protein [Tanacetum cinerariifolium]
TMADMNIPANDAPTEQAPAVTPPTRTDDQILSSRKWVPIGKTAGYDRPRHHVLQILWGIIHRSNIDYAKRIWEEFVQSIQTFLTDRKNLTTASRGKKKTTHLLIPSVRFTKLIIHHLKTKHNIHPRTGLPLHYSHEENILNTLMFVRKEGFGGCVEVSLGALSPVVFVALAALIALGGSVVPPSSAFPCSASRYY